MTISGDRDKDKKIGPLKIGEDYIYDAREICEILVEQYNSQFSRSKSMDNTSEGEINDTKEGDLTDIDFNEEDIAKAIDKLNKNSAAGPDGIPTIFLINTKNTLKHHSK